MSLNNSHGLHISIYLSLRLSLECILKWVLIFQYILWADGIEVNMESKSIYYGWILKTAMERQRFSN